MLPFAIDDQHANGIVGESYYFASGQEATMPFPVSARQRIAIGLVQNLNIISSRVDLQDAWEERVRTNAVGLSQPASIVPSAL